MNGLDISTNTHVWIDLSIFVSYETHAMDYFKYFYASGTQDAEVTKSLENVQRAGLNFQGAFNSREVQP